MKLSRFSTGGQLFFAGFFVALLVVMPFWFAVMIRSIPAIPAAGPTPLGVDLSIFRFNVFLLSLAFGLTTALAYYIAPSGEEQAYTRSALPFYAVFYVTLLFEAAVTLSVLSGSTTVWLRAGEFVLALALNIPVFAISKRLGLSARQQPQSIGARFLEKCRRLPVGYGFGGQILRLNL